MRLIIIEKMDPDFPCIVTDEEGKPKIFDNYFDAQIEANDCQCPQIIELD